MSDAGWCPGEDIWVRVVSNFELACLADVSLCPWRALNRSQILGKRDSRPSANAS